MNRTSMNRTNISTENCEDITRAAILELVRKRGFTKTVCPSEVARQLAPKNWRGLMEHVRDVAKDLRKDGLIEICQKGEPVKGDDWKGPIRLRLCKSANSEATHEIENVGERFIRSCPSNSNRDTPSKGNKRKHSSVNK